MIGTFVAQRISPVFQFAACTFYMKLFPFFLQIPWFVAEMPNTLDKGWLREATHFIYFRSNLKYLHAFFNVDHNLKVGDMSLFYRFQNSIEIWWKSAKCNKKQTLEGYNITSACMMTFWRRSLPTHRFACPSARLPVCSATLRPLSWLSNATLKIFISGVSSRILMP